MKTNIINQDKRIEENKVIIKKTTEDVLSKNDLMIMKHKAQEEKERLKDSMRQIKKRYDALTNQEKEIDELISMIPDEEVTLED
ncbi:MULTISPECIES: hypothetical protein [Vallitalea]|uniref:Uncharacterized protein n=1 Tax=Vallitalea maricola TaxID=3074433 RepID=A0ACB5UFH6_9FIRM|nr:hypothetical protein [Vallitalea guaymasensis]GMQ61206.1 hypothetical protein AN2V17_04340 [Vallitalea sp. AN17-2]